MTRKKSLVEKVLTPNQLNWFIKNKEHPESVHLVVTLNESMAANYFKCADHRKAEQLNRVNTFKKYLESIGVN